MTSRKENSSLLTASNYYSVAANQKYFSVSQYKDFMKCEAMAMAKIKGEYIEPVTRPLLIGAFVDTYFEGTLDSFMKENPAIFTLKNELRAEFRKANEIIARIKADELFMKFLGGEKQKILTFNLFGVPWKIKIDSFLPEICITDLKTAANFRTLPYFRYDLQGTVYQYGVEANGYGRLPFYLAVATKERIPNLDIFQVPQSTLDMALKEIGDKLPRFIDIKDGIEVPEYCGVCDYCKKIKKARIRNYNELLEV